MGSMARRTSRGMSAILALLLLGVGLWTAAWYAPALISAARATRDWVPVAGSVASARAAVQAGSKGRTRHHVAIEYRYEAGGALRTSDRYSVGGMLPAGDAAQAELLARAYRPGDPLTVYVDPLDPTRSVLARGGEQKAWFTLAFGLVLILAAGWVLVRRVVLARP